MTNELIQQIEENLITNDLMDAQDRQEQQEQDAAQLAAVAAIAEGRG